MVMTVVAKSNLVALLEQKTFPIDLCQLPGLYKGAFGSTLKKDLELGCSQGSLKTALSSQSEFAIVKGPKDQWWLTLKARQFELFRQTDGVRQHETPASSLRNAGDLRERVQRAHMAQN